MNEDSINYNFLSPTAANACGTQTLTNYPNYSFGTSTSSSSNTAIVSGSPPT